MRGCRRSSRSIASQSSSAVASSAPSSSPGVSVCVSEARPRAVASFERGSRTRAAIIAAAEERIREGRRSSSLSRPGFRAVPATAATCPWGRERRISKASSIDFRATPPLSRMRSPRTISSGHFERLARVRLQTLPSLRKDSRSRTAGGEFRLGTRSMYMGIMVTDMLNHVKMDTESLHGYSIRMPKSTRVFRLQHVNRDNRPDSVPNFGLIRGPPRTPGSRRQDPQRRTPRHPENRTGRSAPESGATGRAATGGGNPTKRCFKCADRAIHHHERNRMMARTKRDRRSYSVGEWGRNRVRGVR